MMNSGQRGAGALDLLVTLALMLGIIFWVFSDYLPAHAEDLQAVIVLAEPSPVAKSVLAASLKDTPNPNRNELRRLRNRVNEIIVTEMARTATGDETLETPSERDASRAMQRAARLAAIESKAWGEMSNEERAEFLVSKWPLLLGFLAFFGFGRFGWRAIGQAVRGY